MTEPDLWHHFWDEEGLEVTQHRLHWREENLPDVPRGEIERGFVDSTITELIDQKLESVEKSFTGDAKKHKKAILENLREEFKQKGGGQSTTE